MVYAWALIYFWLMVGAVIWSERDDLGTQIILTWPFHMIRNFLK